MYQPYSIGLLQVALHHFAPGRVLVLHTCRTTQEEQGGVGVSKEMATCVQEWWLTTKGKQRGPDF